MVGCSFRVDDVEDALARDDEAVAEALAFGGVFTRLEFWILAFVVAGEIADDVRVLRLGEDEGRRVVRFKLLESGCEIRQIQWNRQGGLTENQVSLFVKGLLPPALPTKFEGIIPEPLRRAIIQSALETLGEASGSF